MPRQIGDSIRVLVIEDSSSDAHLIKEALRTPHSGYSFIVTDVPTVSAGLRMIPIENFDIILLDLNLPDHFGVDSFHALQKAKVDLPVIILSGSVDDELAIRTVMEGAQDYISKNEIAAPLLVKTIRYAIARYKLSTVEKQHAEKLSRLKSEFLASMSHEIRTPMNGVIGMTSLLMETELTCQQKEYVNSIRSSGEILLTILNEILDYSKIESGKVQLELIDFNVRKVAEETADLFSEQARQKKLCLSTFIEPSVPKQVKGDPTRLRQVIANLLNNAVKFTSSGCIQLRVGVQNADSERPTIRFSVKDTGIGIAPEALDTLFRVFTQADRSTTRKFGGTGLGLAISKQLVELMGGKIVVESKKGEGSTFSFTAAFSPVLHPEPQVSRPDLQGRRVLISASATLGPILREQLTARGLQVDLIERSKSIEFCVTKARQAGNPYNLILNHQPNPITPLGFAYERLLPFLTRTPVLHLAHQPIKSLHFGPRSASLLFPYKQSELYRYASSLLSGVVVEERPARKSLPGRLRTLLTRTPLAKGRVLVADDNHINQMVALRMLQNLGFRTDVVGDGLEAVAAAKRVPYNAILMDCFMPEMDGFEATRQLRVAEGHRHVPIIAMTANAYAEDREKCLEAGMDDYLAKPLQMEDLAKALARNTASQISKPKKGASMANQDWIDLETINALRRLNEDGGTEFLNEVIEMFLKNTPAVIVQLDEAIQKKDAQAVKLTAHRLKGFSGNLGLKKMIVICENIEKEGASGTLETSPEQMKKLWHEFEFAKEKLAHGWSTSL